MEFLKRKIVVISIILTIILLILFSYTYNRNTRGNAENGVQVSMNVFQKFFYTIGSSTSKFVTFITSYNSIQKEVEYYKTLSTEYERNGINYKKLEEENDRLRAQANFQLRNESLNERYNFIGAEVVSKGENNTYTLSRGTNVGVQTGNVIVAYASNSSNSEKIEIGLVGKVISVGKNFCIIQTILDQNLTVAAMIENSDEGSGALRGYYNVNNSFMTQLQMPETTINMNLEDIVITSGEGYMYPKGIKIGKIKSVTEEKATLSKVAKVEPFVDFNDVDIVTIIVLKDGATDYEGGVID